MLFPFRACISAIARALSIYIRKCPKCFAGANFEIKNSYVPPSSASLQYSTVHLVRARDSKYYTVRKRSNNPSNHNYGISGQHCLTVVIWGLEDIRFWRDSNPYGTYKQFVSLQFKSKSLKVQYTLEYVYLHCTLHVPN